MFNKAWIATAIVMVSLSMGQRIVTAFPSELVLASPFFKIGDKVYSLDDHSLKLVSTASYDGEDTLGTFSASVQQLLAGQTRVKTIAKNYTAVNAMTYTAEFIDGASIGSSNDSNAISSGYPCFEVPDDSQLGYLSFGGSMFGDLNKVFGRWNKDAKLNDGLVGGPLSVFDRLGDTLIFSPMDEFMITSLWHDISKSRVCHGVMGTVPEIPKLYSYTSIVYSNVSGINQAFEAWGRLLQKYYQRSSHYRDSDLVLNYLGYWTDGGAYYFYNTEPSMTYQQTIRAVKDDFSKKKLPYKYLQLDSWWYFKDNTTNQDVTRWEPMPSVFPDGMSYIWDNTNLPLACHNRQWSHMTPYAKENGGDFDFIVEHDHEIAVPQDPSFWQYLFSQAAHWGLTMYEQDHLDQQTESSEGLRSSVTAGRQWLRDMGRAAQQQGLTLQYCMSLPRHALQSLEIPVVTHARVSGDYRGGSDQWKIGVSSMFAHALGIAPFKDCFWTTSTYQPGNTYNLSEPYPELMVVVATLSTGPVAPADKLDYTNVTNLMQCCNQDGLILKPSRPALAINDQILQIQLGFVKAQVNLTLQLAFNDTEGPQGEVWSTYSQIGPWRFGILLAAGLNNTYIVTPKLAGFDNDMFGNKLQLYKSGTPGHLVEFSNVKHLKLDTSCGLSNFCLYYTAPTFIYKKLNLVLIGELDKVVPMSSQRVKDISLMDGDDVTVTLAGAPGEHVIFSLVLDNQWLRYDCIIAQSGQVVLTMKGGGQCKLISNVQEKHLSNLLEVKSANNFEQTKNVLRYESEHRGSATKLYSVLNDLDLNNAMEKL